jgi:bifunctional non-homologous end joining protein LigD
VGLDEYHRKRNFAITPEPRGSEGTERRQGRSFVVQKHAASHLHYDFRLELEGVLKSWSVPKGPCFDPTVKRLAMATEDHPLDYGDFEGVIPESEYGGGTVMLWDRGTWEPLGDPHKEFHGGNLKFELHGEKLRGRWALVRIRGKDRRDGDRSWLLIKERDELARPEPEFDVTLARPESVTTGRSLEQIAAASDRVWHSNRPPDPGKGQGKGKARWLAAARAPAPLPPLPGARPAPLPARFEPPQPRAARKPPPGDDWLHELAIDGPRLGCRIEDGRARLLDGDGGDWTERLPAVAASGGSLPVRAALLDGAVSVLLPDGTTSWAALDEHLAGGGAPGQPLCYFAFDLVHVDGQDLTAVPLEARKQALLAILGGRKRGSLAYVDHIAGAGADLFTRACASGVSGLLSRKRDGHYQIGASKEWVATSCPRAATGDGEHTKMPTKKPTKTLKKTPTKTAKTAKTATPREPTAPASRPAAGKRGDASAQIAGVRLSHPERVLYPDAGISKLDLARYYEAVADWIVPAVSARPLALVRCPDGLASQCFYMKHAMKSVAPELGRIKIREQTKTGEYLLADSLAALVGLAQMSVLEIHTWNSTSDHLEQPDRVVFDLDPGPEVAWAEVVKAARLVRDRLAALGLTSFVKTTGGKGLHVVQPLAPSADWEDCFTFSRLVAESIAAEAPTRYTTTMAKAGREDKILLDFFRNRRGSTAIAAFSTRARPGAPVSLPVSWEEIEDRKAVEALTIRTVPAHLAARRRDPWHGYEGARKPLSAVLDAMQSPAPRKSSRRG